MFIDPVYSLQNIYQAYQMSFHPLQNEEYWSTYNGPNFILDPHMRRKHLEDQQLHVSIMKWMNQSTNQKSVLIIGMKDTIGVIAHIDNKLRSFVKIFCNLIIYFSFSFPYPIFYLLHLKT